jgi:hypothetical protein
MTPQDKQLIDEMIRGIRAEISSRDEVIMLHLTQILEQTKKTNGRVSKLELETGISRWFERKPIRFTLFVIFFLALSVEGIRSFIEGLL